MLMHVALTHFLLLYGILFKTRPQFTLFQMDVWGFFSSFELL